MARYRSQSMRVLDTIRRDGMLFFHRGFPRGNDRRLWTARHGSSLPRHATWIRS
ncbi:hypothetical protein GCM10010210_29480 [Pseudonocardia hydrocarbonoxydans]|uniref:Uncharacterized protein n=1 Tax=Pseudonocardia hydrocarbonoxydans TaxID=76726 RepID=A0A4Y3WMV2_9PSEU|nr:hypothetical protein PHY01_09390 [Pseudonocardia hydrocarbonoxydans]